MVETAEIHRASKMTEAPPKPVPFWKRLHIPVQFTAWPGIRTKSPIPLDSRLLDEKWRMLEKLTGIRTMTLDFVEKNRNRNFRGYRFRHPFLGSLNLYDWLRMIVYQETRHTYQLREIVEFFQI